MFFLLGIPLAVLVALSARLLAINRNRFQLVTFIYSLVVTSALLAVGFGWLPITTCIFVTALAPMAVILVQGDRPLRMDYNLFLRATQVCWKTPRRRAGKRS